ncbi:M48 family metallopeptidase [Calditrichota bacterium GD2]
MQELTREQQAKRYERIKLIVSISESVLSFLLLLLFLTTGYSAELRDWTHQLTENAYLRFLLFMAAAGFGLSLFTFPFEFYSSFILEHRYHLSNQTLWDWIKEKLKENLVGLAIGLPLALAFYFLLLNFPQTWWLWLSVVVFLFSVLLGRIAPQVIFPLFYKFEPLEDAELLQRMERLAKIGKFDLQGIFRFNMSKDTKKANAAFTGLGKSRRIVIGDTLLENFTHDEIEAVFAHEVGHFVHKHLYKLMAAGTLQTFVGFYLAHLIYRDLLTRMGFTGPADLAALPLIAIILTVYMLLVSPLSNALSRHYERQADLYALRHSGNPRAFASALLKLSEQNLSDKQPHPLVEFFFHSHPSIQKRVEMVEEFLQGKKIERI